MMLLHADRDRIKAAAEADFLNLYLDHGGRQRGKALLCLFHEDQSPSASIYKGRFRCFACNISVDVIEFVQRAQRVNFRRALTYLAHHYGIPDGLLSPADRQQHAREKQARDHDLPVAELWRRAAVGMAEQVLCERKSALFDPVAEVDDRRSIIAEIESFEWQLDRWRSITGRELVEAYRAFRASDPALIDAMLQAVRRRQRIEERALWRVLMGVIE